MNNRTWPVAESTCMINLTISEHSCICMGSTAAEAGKKDIVSYIYIYQNYICLHIENMMIYIYFKIRYHYIYICVYI